MPRAGDAFLLGALPRTHDPLVRINHQPPVTDLFDLESFIDMWQEFVNTYLLGIIEDVTGIDLSSLEALSDLFFDNFIGLIPGVLGGLSGAAGLGAIFGDLFGLLGSPTGVGGGSPLLPGIGAIPILGGLLSGSTLLGGLIPLLDASKIGSGTFGPELLQPLIDALSLGFGGGSGLNFTSLQSLLTAIPGAGEVLDMIVGSFLGVGGGGFGLPDLASALISIPARFLAGALVPGQVSNLGVGTVSNVLPQLLVNGNFDAASSLVGQNVFHWDGTQGPSGVGTSVYTTADGTVKELFSNAIPVAPAQALNISGWTKWSGFTGAANSIALTVVKYADGALHSTETIGAVASPGASGGWTQLSSTYTVPSGVDTIFLRPLVTAGATAGTVWFGKLSVKPTGTTVYNPLIPLLDASKIGSGEFPIAMITGLGSQLTGTLNAIWEGVYGAAPIGNVLFADVIGALQAIPATSVLGLSGAATIADTITNTIDTLWGGFARLFGSTGKSITDVAAQAANTVETATTGLELGEWNNAILGIRNNKSLMEGMDETEESNFLLSDLFSAAADPQGVIAATSSNVPISFWRATEDATKGVISWFGKGFTNVTNLYIDIYKFNYATSTMELIHTSDDQIAQVTGSWSLCQHFLDVADRFQVVAGDVIGVAWRVVGTGTHSIAGKVAGSWLPAHPTAVPAKPSATRTGSGNLAFGSITYSNELAWFGIGIATGDVPPDYHSPRTTQFTTTGAYTYDVPDWANYVDEIKVGGGGGGHGGDTVTGNRGKGGNAGAWDSLTLVRGTDFGSGTGIQLTGTVGAGGGHGPAAGDGGNGTATTRAAISGGAAASSAAGGAGGGNYGSPKAGGSPGVHTFNGVDYQGGAGGSASGSTGGGGQTPGAGGGGGQGGTWGVAWPGGAGARGAVWFVARQI